MPCNLEHCDAPAGGGTLPFELIFFVLADGWSLVAGSLIQSYGT
jgi:flagellar biosynthetic protein FliP